MFSIYGKEGQMQKVLFRNLNYKEPHSTPRKAFKNSSKIMQ